jgi:hypothetical protein
MLFAINRFMKIFFDKKRTSLLVYFLIYLTYPIIICTPFFLSINIPVVNLLCSITAIFLITLNYEGMWKRRITAVCFIYPLMFIADVLSSSLLGYFHISLMEQREGDYTLTLIVVSLLLYFESILAQNFKNIRKQNYVSSVFWVSSITIPLASIFIAVIVLSSSNTRQITIITFVILIFLINILTFYLHDSLSAAYTDKLKLSLFEQEKEYFYNQCELMRKSTEELKSFRHDVKNLLFTATEFIQQNQIDEALNYLKKLTGRTETNTNYSRTGNIAFDSIINYKLRNASEQDINLKVDVDVPQKLNVEIADIVTIMGNLLDNALNAVMKTSERKICLKIAFTKGNIIINIQNTFNGDMRCVNGEIVSIDGENHGYGLKNIRSAAEKYNGYMDIHYIDKLFSVDVFLYAQSI